MLPDLVTEILLRLPAKSLLRFRCLSNSFRDEIDTPDFAQMHLKRSINTRTRRKLFFTRSSISIGPHEKKILFSADFDDGLKKAFKIHNQFTDLEQYTTGIIGACHGLILLYAAKYGSPDLYSESDLFLWNPTTLQIKELPPCPGRLTRFAALGFDSAFDNYKVVVIVRDSRDAITQTMEPTYKVWVYNLKSNSWRYAQSLDPNISINLRPDGFANGFLYWKYTDWEDGSTKIGCFDLANEVFITLPGFYTPPDDDLLGVNALDRNRLFGIKVVEGNVMMHTNFKGFNVHKFYSSVVDNVSGLAGDGGNWSKSFTFEAQGPRTYVWDVFPLAYSKDRNCVLLNIRNEAGIFWYNMEKKTRHNVEFLREMDKSYRFDCYVLWESLVSLGNDGEVQV